MTPFDLAILLRAAWFDVAVPNAGGFDRELEGQRELAAVVPSEQRSQQDKCFSRMGLPPLRPEESASHDLKVFYHVPRRTGSD
jgi:hypothetical protein